MNLFQNPDDLTRIARIEEYEPSDGSAQDPSEQHTKFTASSAAPFSFELFGDLEAAPHKPWLVQDLLGAGELSVMFGAPGCGKSALAGDLAAHVAQGEPWFGYHVRSGGVLYVAAERSTLVKRRFAALRKRKGLNSLPLAIISGVFDLCGSRADTESLITTAEVFKQKTGVTVSLVIIDTKAQVMGGGDENAARDMSALVANLSRIQAATSAHVLVIDHVPHDNQHRMRGHGSLLGAADSTFRISQTAGVRQLEVGKANDSPDDVRLAFTLEAVVLGTNPDTGELTTAPVVVPSELPDRTRTGVPVRLSGSEELAFRSLNEVLAEQGRNPPIGIHAPRGTKVVAEDEWRKHCYNRQISGSDKQDAKQKAFKRAADSLQVKGKIAVANGWVWTL